MSFELKFNNYPGDSGSIKYAHVPWDSELFGFPFVELRLVDTTPAFLSEHLTEFLNDLPGNSYCLVCTKIPTSAVEIARVLARSGFYPVETLFELRLSFQKFSPALTRQFIHLQLRHAKERDLPTLVEIAGSAFNTDRFHLDPNLPYYRADQRYQGWISHGFHVDEPIFVLEDARTGDLLGFLHTRALSTTTIDLSLAAVLNNPKISGTGLVLYQKALLELQERGYKFAVTRISVNNLAIVNVLSSLGFAFTNTYLTMHWFRDVINLP